MALAIQRIAEAMLEEDPEKAAEKVREAEAAFLKFKDSIIPAPKDPPKFNMERLVP